MKFLRSVIAGLFLFTAASATAQPIIPSTAYTLGFMKSASASAARTYLGVTSGSNFTALGATTLTLGTELHTAQFLNVYEHSTVVNGGDSSVLFFPMNYQGSGFGVGFPSVGTGATSPFGQSPESTYLGQDGATVNVYDKLAGQFMFVPWSCPNFSDKPGYLLLVANSGERFSLCLNGAGGNASVFQTRLNSHVVDMPLAQFSGGNLNTNTLEFGQAGFIDAFKWDCDTGIGTIYSNLFVGGKISTSGNPTLGASGDIVIVGNLLLGNGDTHGVSAGHTITIQGDASDNKVQFGAVGFKTLATGLGYQFSADNDGSMGTSGAKAKATYSYTYFGGQAAISTSNIDASTATYFYKQVASATPFLIQNMVDGETIQVAVSANGSAVTWTGPVWAAGTAPTQTANKTDIYTFTQIHGTNYGAVVQGY